PMEEYLDETEISTRGSTALPPLIAEKLAAYERIAGDVEAAFRYIEDMHGQRRFSHIPIEETVRYLHALWLCDRKDMLLSVPTSSGRRKRGSGGRYERFEGQHALELLCAWQQGEMADVVAFLEMKLGQSSFADITRNIGDAARRGDRALVRRLKHGRETLLNRTHNLTRALSVLFNTPPDTLHHTAIAACARYGHTVAACQEQLAEIGAPLYTFVPHPALARRNMRLMNALGIAVSDNNTDRPGRRTRNVQRPKMPNQSYADHVVAGEMTMVATAPPSR
ncbi:MAG TPA: hypothetical protein VFN11_15755, partial [Ktedonobacterales bacterium]|nr:hypothetical protein [Ktedonobacterales bacterium]